MITCIKASSLASVVAALIPLLLGIAPAPAAPWINHGPLNLGRHSHTATLLLNGQVLVAGGLIDDCGGNTNSAELYDPATGLHRLTGPMTAARHLHTATLLLDGSVLVAGGFGGGQALSSAEWYDPATGNWTATGAMTTQRWLSTATLLPDGRVLVTGGAGANTNAINRAELYDPATRTWIATGPLNVGRFRHTAGAPQRPSCMRSDWALPTPPSRRLRPRPPRYSSGKISR